MQQFNCPYCGFLLIDDGRMAGFHASCPQCCGEFYIPDASPLPLVIAPPIPNHLLPSVPDNEAATDNFRIVTEGPGHKAPHVTESRPMQSLWLYITIGFAALLIAVVTMLVRKRNEDESELLRDHQSGSIAFQQESNQFSSRSNGGGRFDSGAFGPQVRLPENLSNEYRIRGIALEEVFFILVTIGEYDPSPSKVEFVLVNWPVLVDAMGGKQQFDKAMRGSDADFSVRALRLSKHERVLALELRKAYKSWLPDKQR